MHRTLCLLIGLLALAGCAATEGNDSMRDIDGVPLPVQINPRTGLGLEGAWFGTWGTEMKHLLVLGPARPDGTAEAVYAYGDNPAFRIERGHIETQARVIDRQATVTGQFFTADYKLTATGRLSAVYQSDDGFGTAILTRHPLPAPGAAAPWTFGEQVFLETGIGSETIEMEAILFKPPGPGPFALAVVNHGSTGTGADPDLFGQTWRSDALADFLIARGWMVAFPQRRGRGRTGGLYDEGFAEDRAYGYTCEAAPAKAGFDRAIDDLAAAITALQTRRDVQDGPVLLAGQPRGGILSVAFAGRYPYRVKGVVNFVGGWLGEGCSTAAEVNQSLIAEGARFARPMLRVYGDKDTVYSMQHSRATFKAYAQAGGQATFHEVTVPGRQTGHEAIGVPALWAAELDAYLGQLDAR